MSAGGGQRSAGQLAERDTARGSFGLLLAWLGLLVSALVALHALGGRLAPPPLTDPGGVGDWLGGRQPAEAAFSVVRLLALGLAWYLLAATVAGVLARLSRVPALVVAADLFSTPAVRRIVNVSAGATLAAATLTGAAGMAAAASGRSAEPEPAGSGEMMTLVSDGHDGPVSTIPVLTRLPADDTPSPAPVLPTLRRLPDGPAPPPDPHPRRWEVRPGQHFWSVAEEVLAVAARRPPTDTEIDRYWRVLIEANRDILRDPGNPDLLYPGQVLTIPEPASPSPSPSPGPPPGEPGAESGALAPDS